MTKFKKVSFTAAGTAVVLGITIGLTFPGFAKALSAPKPIQAVSAAVVVQPTVTTVTTPKQLAPKVAPVTGPTTQVAPSITTTTQEAIITYMDLSGYCTTVDVSNAPSGAVNVPNCVSNPKPFYFRDDKGFCGITGQGEASQDGLIYDATCEPAK